MSMLPKGWSSTNINELITLNPKNEFDDQGEVGFVPMQHVGTGFRDYPKWEPRKWSEVKKGYTHFANGDVLLAKITPCFENGKAGILRGLPNGIGAGSTEYFVCRPLNTVVSSEYLLAFFKTVGFLEAGQVRMTGSVGHKRVPKDFLLNTEVPLAPHNEQKRIIKKLDALLKRVDACREKLDRVPLILKRFRQAVLAAATSGALTEVWREESLKADEPCGPFRSEAEGDAGLPRGWKWLSVADVCDAIVDCPHSTPKWTASGRLCIRTTNFKPGFLDLSEVQYVSNETFDQRIQRLRPKPGDVVYSREGAILGIACQIPDDVELCLGQRMMLFRTSSHYCAQLLMHCLNSPQTLARVQELTGGSASPHLNVRDIKALPLPVPPLSEQREIVRRVAKLLSLAQHLESRYLAARKQVDQMTPSLLAKAFRGELVEQDPNDEPASVLLERIKAERAKSATTRPSSPLRSGRKSKTAKSVSKEPENVSSKGCALMGADAGR